MEIISKLLLGGDSIFLPQSPDQYGPEKQQPTVGLRTIAHSTFPALQGAEQKSYPETQINWL